MLTAISNFFKTQGFMPHGMCISWQPLLLWTLVISDVLIFVAYFTIPLALIYLVKHREDLKFKGIIMLFSVFILACGMSHVLTAVTYWYPIYGISAIAKAVTAVVSVMTAILVWPQLPRAINYPSPTMLARKNLQLAKANEKLEELARTDFVTKLPNRFYFVKLLKDRLRYAKEHNRVLAVLFLDLDLFKSTNDSLGHDAGDLLLIQVANRLKSTFREEDVIARFGGDEFILCIAHKATHYDFSECAERALSVFNTPFQVNNTQINLTSSVGVVTFPESGKTADELISNADVAMYYAKDLGRNNYQFFNDEISKVTMRRILIERELHNALQHDQFYLVFQPVIDLEDSSTKGFEVLLRWNSPVLGEVMPMELIKVAESTGLITDVGRWVFNHACESYTSLCQKYKNFELYMAVNLSAMEIRSFNFQKYILEKIGSCKIDPGRIALEITETVLMEDIEYILPVLDELKQVGIQFSIDDFGTGYSSLAYLHELPLRALKIDISFIRKIVSDENDRKVVQAIINLANSLNLKVVAEGVETIEQAEVLKSLGCPLAQGYYFAKPLSQQNFEAYLTKELA